jgi:hypothetical protein
MSKNEKIQMIKNAVEVALSQYDTDNVDIVKSETDSTVDIMYHSRHNSFPIVSNVCTSDGLSESDIDKIAEHYDIGCCW